MAHCPNCGKHLPIWYIKAECNQCGVSIPNYNWVGRLEEDNINAEKSFAVFNKTINRVKYSLFGTKLRIARLVLTFIPIIAFIIPWATVNGSGNSFKLVLISLTGGKSALDVFSQLLSNSTLLISNMQFEAYSGPVTFITFGTILYFLTLLLIVIAFFMNIIKCAHPKTKSTFIFDIFAIITSIISVVLFSTASSLGNEFVAFTVGSISSYGISGGFSLGYLSCIVLFLLATGINIAVAVAPAKSDEELENERLAKKEEKEAIARENEIKKQKAREEAEKAAAEEQKNIVAEAKKKLAEKQAKDAEKANKHKN